MLVLVLLLLTALISSLLAMTVWFAGARGRLNHYLAIFTAFIGFWAVGDVLLLYADNHGLVRLGLTMFYFCPVVVTLFVLYFADSSPSGKPIKDSLLLPTAAIAIVLGGLLLLHPDLLVEQITISDISRNIVLPNSLMLGIYGLYFDVFFLMTYIKLIIRYRRSRGTSKHQLLIMLTGISISSALAVTTNLVFPQMGIYDKIWMGPIFTLFFAGMTVVAILKFRFLNIKLFAARATAYLAVLGTFIGSYALLLYFASRLLLQAGPIRGHEQTVSAAIAMLLALSLRPLKRFFDKVSNSLFYRDAYDPQDFIDQLNKVLVTKIGLDQLLQQAAQVIEEHIKVTFAAFYIRPTDYSPRRIIGGNIDQLKDLDIAVLDNAPLTLLRPSEKDPSLTPIRKHGVNIFVRLMTTPDQDTKGSGYFLIGYKKSGNPFTAKDLKILEIVANELAIAIQNALRFEEIENFNLTLQEKVTEATNKFRRTNEKLRLLDETKDEFISMASHQLRTPLTSVKGYLSMVLEGDAGKLNDMQRKLLTQAFVSSQRMVYLIADLLNVSRLKTGKFVLDTVPVNLADVIASEIDQMKDAVQARRLKLHYDKPRNFPLLLLDETKIHQVVMNFIDNAIYYTPNGGHITVCLEDKPHHIEYTVTDTGMGVPRSEQHHLFSKFYRADNARKARPDGTGLGLFMAKKVIIASGGAIIFKSQEGKGSTFGFCLPKAKLLVNSPH